MAGYNEPLLPKKCVPWYSHMGMAAPIRMALGRHLELLSCRLGASHMLHCAVFAPGAQAVGGCGSSPVARLLLGQQLADVEVADLGSHDEVVLCQAACALPQQLRSGVCHAHITMFSLRPPARPPQVGVMVTEWLARDSCVAEPIINTMCNLS